MITVGQALAGDISEELKAALRPHPVDAFIALDRTNKISVVPNTLHNRALLKAQSFNMGHIKLEEIDEEEREYLLKLTETDRFWTPSFVRTVAQGDSKVETIPIIRDLTKAAS